MGAHLSKCKRSKRRPNPKNPPNTVSATASSAFFQTLPPELRRRILIAAFGGGTLHVGPHPAMACCRRGSLTFPDLSRPDLCPDKSPARDDCRATYPWPLGQGGQWVIGAWGWLRVCRQA